MAVTAAPDIDLFRRLSDAGATAVISYPLVYSVGPGASLEVKRQALERYGNEFIAKI